MDQALLCKLNVGPGFVMWAKYVPNVVECEAIINRLAPLALELVDFNQP